MIKKLHYLYTLKKPKTIIRHGQPAIYMIHWRLIMTEGERHLCEYEAEMSGSFFTCLFKAMFKADLNNLDRLAKGFPEEVDALHRYRNEDGYWDKLQKEFR